MRLPNHFRLYRAWKQILQRETNVREPRTFEEERMLFSWTTVVRQAGRLNVFLLRSL